MLRFFRLLGVGFRVFIVFKDIQASAWSLYSKSAIALVVDKPLTCPFSLACK